jgi:hypothetical protein
MDFECLSRQSSLVINIVGTDGISRLPHLVTGLTEVGRGGGGGQVNPPPLSCVHSSVCCFVIPTHPPGDKGGQRPQTDRRGGHNT